MKNLRLPLSGRILILAFVNLTLLAGVFAVIARLQFHAEFGSFFFAAARDRVLSVARELALDLERTPVASRNQLMARYTRAYGVDFYLFEGDGTQLAGVPVGLPPEVQRELMKRPPRGDPRPPPPPRREDGEPPPPGPRGPRNDVFQISDGGRYWVGARIPIAEPGTEDPVPGTLIMAAASFYSARFFFDLTPLIAAAVVVIGIFLLCWVPFIRSLTRSISQVTRATERISQGDFDLHVPDNRTDELGQLSAAINRMAARLSGFVLGQKRFLGDIAHELCAPIARIQFGLGILEQRAEPGQLRAVEDVQDEMRQMSALVGELLSFSKAGMEPRERPLSAVDLGQVVRQAIAREAPEIAFDLPQPMTALADPDYLLRALSNLLRNAVRYAGHAGPVSVSVRRDHKEAVIVVSDCGPGIPPAELDRVFTPFYRLETSRNREMGGAGLGLSIVKSCVDACQGRVECRNRQPSGLEVEIRLKLSLAPAD